MRKDRRGRGSYEADDHYAPYDENGYAPEDHYRDSYDREQGGYYQDGYDRGSRGYDREQGGYYQDGYGRDPRGYDREQGGYYQDGYGRDPRDYGKDPRGNGRNVHYQDPYREREERMKKTARRKRKRRTMFIIEVLILIVLAGGLFVVSKIAKIRRTDMSKDDVVMNEGISDSLKGYTNIALFGVDSREGDLDRDAHSDALMVASINNKTKDVRLVSVYRDTYLDNTNGEYRKATECYYFGGPKRAIDMLNKNLDLDITDFVTVDFSAVAEVVDALGGIEIDVQEDEIVHLNNYQQEGSQVTGKEIVPVEYAGIQTLNGLQALSYCRIRYTEGSDFKRTERQRTVLKKILEKAKAADLLTLNNLIDQIAENMLTSLSNAELLSLAKDVGSYDLVDQTGFPFNLANANLSAGDCVVPVNLENNVIQLHQWLFGTDGYAPSEAVQEISWQIINDTGIQ